jgi:hypothetical protein
MEKLLKPSKKRAKPCPPPCTWCAAQLALLKDLAVTSQLHASSTSGRSPPSHTGRAAAALKQAKQLTQQLLLQRGTTPAVH